MEISKLCYELYKTDWKLTHKIGAKEDLYLKEYFRSLVASEDVYTFEYYLRDNNGYNGAMYLTYDDFLKTRYLDVNYMRNLLKDLDLIDMYYQDISFEANARWILITCEEQDISEPDVFETYEEAFEAMQKAYEDVLDDADEHDISPSYAYIRKDDYACDWRIIEVRIDGR